MRNDMVIQFLKTVVITSFCGLTLTKFSADPSSGLKTALLRGPLGKGTLRPKGSIGVENMSAANGWALYQAGEPRYTSAGLWLCVLPRSRCGNAVPRLRRGHRSR